MTAHDTLLSANRKAMFHNAAIPAWCEPEEPFTVAHRVGGKYEGGGQYRLTTYAKAESVDWKAIPDWHRA